MSVSGGAFREPSSSAAQTTQGRPAPGRRAAGRISRRAARSGRSRGRSRTAPGSRRPARRPGAGDGLAGEPQRPQQDHPRHDQQQRHHAPASTGQETMQRRQQRDQRQPGHRHRQRVAEDLPAGPPPGRRPAFVVVAADAAACPLPGRRVVVLRRLVSLRVLVPRVGLLLGLLPLFPRRGLPLGLERCSSLVSACALAGRCSAHGSACTLADRGSSHEEACGLSSCPPCSGWPCCSASSGCRSASSACCSSLELVLPPVRYCHADDPTDAWPAGSAAVALGVAGSGTRCRYVHKPWR